MALFMQEIKSIKFGCFVLFFFILSAVYGSLYFIKELLFINGPLITHSDNRYTPLIKYFGSSQQISDYISNNEGKPYMYKQVVWYLIDGLAIFVLEPRPNSSNI